MNKIKNFSEGSFLKLLFGYLSAAFLIGAVCMPDRAQMFSGLVQILTQSSKLTCSYFAIGGYAATFLNMALVGLISLLLFVVFKGTPNNVSTLAFILTLGFGSWGINVLNIWPSIFGVVLYALVKKEKLGANVNAMLFSTGIAPIITDLMIRYPHAEVVGFNALGIFLALLVGFVIGIFSSSHVWIGGSGRGHPPRSACRPVYPGQASFLCRSSQRPWFGPSAGKADR